MVKSLSILCLIILIALKPNNMIKSCLAASKVQVTLSASKVQVTLSASKMQPVLSNWQETVLNLMADSTLVVHYKSKDNDLDEHIINVIKLEAITTGNLKKIFCKPCHFGK